MCSIVMYCFICDDNVEWKQGYVVDDKGRRYEAFIHDHESHSFFEDAGLMGMKKLAAAGLVKSLAGKSVK